MKEAEATALIRQLVSAYFIYMMKDNDPLRLRDYAVLRKRVMDELTRDQPDE